jgi:vacuolar-type H+-ATPase catalytic subunit A/Vma1
MTEKQVKIPYSLYKDLIHYFLGSNYDEDWDEIEDRIKAALKEKQESNERRLLYSAKLMQENRIK